MVIAFNGKIVLGQRGHSKLGIPGKESLVDSLSDWPTALYPGSLNVEVSMDDLPSELDMLGQGKVIKKLDNGILKPAFVIDQKDIKNNTIGPGCKVEGKGHGQVWRAKLKLEKNEEIYDCWVFRRLDSAMWRHIELVSDKNLRESLDLNDGDHVIVSIEGDM